MKKTLMIMTALYVIICAAYASDPYLDTFVQGDADGYLYYGTILTLNATVQNVTNHTNTNVTGCTVNGLTMSHVGTIGNGSGVWQINTTLQNLGFALNCTNAVTVNCTVKNATNSSAINYPTITTTNTSWVGIPCLSSSSNSSLISAVTQGSYELAVDYLVAPTPSTILTKSNQTPVNSTGFLYCTVNVVSKEVNVTLFLQGVTYNATHSYCPYDSYETTSTKLTIKQAGYLGGAPPNLPWTTGVMVIIFGCAATGIGYAIGRGRKP